MASPPGRSGLRRRAALAAAGAVVVGCDSGTPPRRPDAAPGQTGGPAPVPTTQPTPLPTPEPTPVPEPEPVIPPGDTHFGVNEGFNAAIHARQLGARWTRWVVEWSEVQRYGRD